MGRFSRKSRKLPKKYRRARKSPSVTEHALKRYLEGIGLPCIRNNYEKANKDIKRLLRNSRWGYKHKDIYVYRTYKWRIVFDTETSTVLTLIKNGRTKHTEGML